jgi:uncharacterized protein YecT (DUF1311 family)
MKTTLFLVLLLSAPAFGTEPQSCIQSASDRESFDECAQKEILPLEVRLVDLMRELDTRYKSDAQRVRALDRSEESWNSYRNSYCTVEAAVRGGASKAEVRRAFAVCAKRTLELRLKELEAL